MAVEIGFRRDYSLAKGLERDLQLHVFEIETNSRSASYFVPAPAKKIKSRDSTTVCTTIPQISYYQFQNN